MATKFITVSIEIMHDKHLSQSQKFILAEIEQLSSLEKGCIASNQHFAELTGVARETVSRAIKDLENKNYINVEIKNGSRNHVRIITIDKTSSLDKTSNPPKQNIKPPLTKHQETKENIQVNIQSNIKESVETPLATPIKSQKKKVMFIDEDMGLAITMYHNILAMNGGMKKPDLEVWANEFRLMREVDYRKVEGMDNFLNSLATENGMWEFWRGNILSPKSMRKNYDQVIAQYRKDVVNTNKVVNQNIPLNQRVSALAKVKQG